MTEFESPQISAAVTAVEQALSDAEVPGMILGITDRVRLRRVIVHGYADIKARTALAPDSRLAIGSISKSFTAIALLQLAAEGRLDLHTPIIRNLPDLALDSPFEPITAHHLLTHTSGLPNYIIHASSSRYVIEALKGVAPGYAPGAHYWYSNTGYQLLTYLLENIERQSYSAIIRRRILKPLRMSATSPVIDDAQRAHLSTSYVRWPYDGTYREAPWFEYTAGDGSLISTVPDMCAYARLILNRGAGPGGLLLSHTDFTTLTTPVLENYAYGLRVTGADTSRVVGHGGSIAGFQSLLEVHLDDGLAVVLLSVSTIRADLKNWIVAMVAAAFQGTDLPSALSKGSDSKADVQAYSGIYQPVDSAMRSLEFMASDGHLLLKSGSDSQPLLKMGADCFRLVDGDSGEPPFFFWRRGTKVVEVSRGAHWYVTEEFSGPRAPPASQAKAAYVGHFESSGPEGPVMRVCIRNGRLWAIVEEMNRIPLEPITPSLFRLGEEAHSPERVQFDTYLDGRALRILLSGVPLYRKDTP